MYLTGMTQREKLFDLASRWLRGRPEAADARFLKLAFLVDPVITAPAVRGLLADVAAPEGEVARVDRLRTKDELRRRIAVAWPHLTLRATGLLSEFERCPERYYPMTPSDAFAITTGERERRAIVRFKSITRVADKVSRRVTKHLEQEIRSRAESLERPWPSGGAARGDPLVEAERLVCLDVASGVLSLDRCDLEIHDLIGAKLIGDRPELQRLEARLVSHPRVVSVRRWEHDGSYRDTHLVVEVACPAPADTVRRLRAYSWEQAARRGLEPDAVRREIPGYVGSAARTFFVEIILTTREDLVESECGRAIHEERTERQRDGLRWARQIPFNVTFLVLFMLLTAIGPKTNVDLAPIRLTGRYLPDAIAVLLGRLFDLEIDRSPLFIPPLVDLVDIVDEVVRG